MVTSPNEQGVVLIGCKDENKSSRNRIYQLIQKKGKLQWEQMNQTLKYPRYKAVSMLISDEIATCETIYSPLKRIIEKTMQTNLTFKKSFWNNNSFE